MFLPKKKYISVKKPVANNVCSCFIIWLAATLETPCSGWGPTVKGASLPFIRDIHFPFPFHG